MKIKSENYYSLHLAGYTCYLISLICLGAALLTFFDKLGLLTIMDDFPIKNFRVPLISACITFFAGKSFFNNTKKTLKKTKKK